jgi:ribosomal protein S18 acetylase RimI-like enzyme
MDNTTIRKVTPADIYELQEIGRRTFFETFGQQNTEEDMEKYLIENFSAAALINEIQNPNSEFYFAINENDIIGYLKLNFGQSQTELKDATAAEIERIYVLNEYHGKSIGKLLYEKALEIAKDRGVNYIWLGVWEENPRAIRFYEKCGFIQFDKHIFKLGNDEQTDIMMRLVLK